MRRNERNAAHFILLILLTAFVLLMANGIVCLALFSKWRADIPFNSQTMMENMTVNQGEYVLSEDMKEALEQSNLFAMILSQEGHILWEERLPKELEKEYTLQDVALFTRYYLDEYPVHTYIIPEGLLVLGSQKHTTWKYTLEYNESAVRFFLRQMPFILLVNIIILISTPLFIQRNWLRKREEERTEWIAGVSHDIRTPLTLILGRTEQIKTFSNDPATLERAEIIETQTLRIRSLVSNLNISSKLEYGMRAYEKTELRISSFLRKAVSDIVNRISETKYQIGLEIEDDLQNTVIQASEDLLTRVIENLINNSIEHNLDGCNVVVKLTHYGQRRNRYCLTVADDGVGVSVETLRLLNGKLNRKNAIAGEHGVGLRVVRQIVKYHHWKMEFTNHHPNGFVCRILF